MTRKTPRLEIDLRKIGQNVKGMFRLCDPLGLSIIGVTKGVLGDPLIAEVFVNNGIPILADSRLANFRRMREAGIRAPFLLLRLPSLSETEEAVDLADYSLNSEIDVIRALGRAAKKIRKTHKVILMVELGDLREGILPEHLENAAGEVLSLDGVKLAGIGVNLGCFGGVEFDEGKIREFSSIAESLERKFRIQLEFVSCGSSNVYTWLKSAKAAFKVNNVRLGDSLLLGGRDLIERGIPGLHWDAFTLVAEVIESKVKPSVPWGEIGLDAFGSIPVFEDRGRILRIILNIGRQDVLFTQLYPRADIDILGASSDHLLADAKKTGLKVGDEVEFDLDYGAMMAALTSPFVEKVYLHK